MLKINENNRINAKDIYSFVEVKTRFDMWIKRCIEYADLQINKDFCTVLSKSTGGRPETVYEFTIDAAKEICIVSATSKAKELRRWLISLSNKRDNLELITVKEAVFATKVINCLKYIENQKEAFSLHRKHFIEKNGETLNEKYIYAEFAKYRNSIIGWDKDKIDNAISEYLSLHAGYNKSKVKNSDSQTKLSIIDISEAIRISVLDILFSKDTDINLAQNFSNLCKKMAKEMEIEPEKRNIDNIFRNKEFIHSVKELSYNQLNQ